MSDKGATANSGCNAASALLVAALASQFSSKVDSHQAWSKACCHFDCNVQGRAFCRAVLQKTVEPFYGCCAAALESAGIGALL